MARPAVFVFIQEGCGACHDFMPRFYRATARFRGLPIGIYDLAHDPKGNRLASAMRVRSTPTTVVMDSHGRFHKGEGAIDQRSVEQLLAKAV
jgi:thiol-disulfide isomerase/thioredoxin